MKKMISFMLTLILILSMGVTVWATELPSGGTQPITATYSQDAPATVYHVDIAWGSMEFVYHSGAVQMWNPNTLTYEIVSGNDEPVWLVENPGDDSVTVTNHSNAAVSIHITYTPDEENGVAGTLDRDNFILESASGTSVQAAPSDTASLTLSTENIPDAFEESTESVVLGTLTVTITHPMDGTNLTSEQLKMTLSEQLAAGKTDIQVALAADADIEMFTAIRRALVDTPTVQDGSIDLTISGVTTVPDGAYKMTYGSGSAERVLELKSISLPDVTTVGELAFESCSNLESVSLPKASTILADAFYECTKLASISIPEVLSIGSNAFVGTSMDILDLSKVTTIGGSVCTTETLTAVNAPALTAIPGGAFDGCENLKNVVAPMVTSVGTNAFAGCNSLETLVLTSEETITLAEFPWGETDTIPVNEQIQLVLNINKLMDVSDETTWNGYTFASITFEND